MGQLARCFSDKNKSGEMLRQLLRFFVWSQFGVPPLGGSQLKLELRTADSERVLQQICCFPHLYIQ